MKEYELQKFLNNNSLVDEQIQEFLDRGIITRTFAKKEIAGHLQKAKHNLSFIQHNIREYPDWANTGCYYACYHAALALLLTKNYSSKNHHATLLLLIKEFYKELGREDIELLARFLDYQDVLFYVEAKNKREDATYTTMTMFSDVDQLRIKAVLFVNKIKSLLE